MRTITIPEKIIPQHTINIYKFNELPEESKEQLLEKHKEKIYKYGYDWEEELYHSIQTACNIFGIEYNEDTYNNLWHSYKNDQELDRKKAEAMSFKRTIAYINNHFNFKQTPYIYKYGDTIADWNKLTKIKIRFDKKREKELNQCKTIEDKFQYRKDHPYPNILSTSCYANDNEPITPYIHPIELATKKLEDNLPTGYCEDYIIHETYNEFIKQAKTIKHENKKYALDHFFTLEDFLSLLIQKFKKARDDEREYQESLEHLEEDIYPDTEFYEDGTIYQGKKE